MRPTLLRSVAFAVTAFVLAGLTGCASLRSWAQTGTGRGANAGASVSVPLGK